MRGAPGENRTARRAPNRYARALVLLTTALALHTGCRTPWTLEPLPVERLELGMDRGEVRRLLGEPEWSDAVGVAHSQTPSPDEEGETGVQLISLWSYSDEVVDPVGLFFAGLFFPVYVPVYVVSLAFPIDDAERDCVWTDQRWIDLYFEDGRLADWVAVAQPDRGWCDNSDRFYPGVMGPSGAFPWM